MPPCSSREIDANKNLVMSNDDTKKMDPLGVAHLLVSDKDALMPKEKQEVESKEWRRGKGTSRKNRHLKSTNPT